MTRDIEFNTLLVPVDFSDNSKAAFARAIQLASGENPVLILLHVLDTSLADFAYSHQFGSRDEVLRRMREQAEIEMRTYVDACPKGIEVDPIISEGVAFLEILQKSDDFAVDVIIMSKIGRRGKFEELLFGSTAEKVLRGSDRPVLVLPSPE